MRNDYAGFGILKDITKYRDRILKVLIKEGMGIEEKTLIRISVNSLNYKELVKKLKELGPCMKRASYKAKDKASPHTCTPWRGCGGKVGHCIYCGKKV